MFIKKLFYPIVSCFFISILPISETFSVDIDKELIGNIDNNENKQDRKKENEDEQFYSNTEMGDDFNKQIEEAQEVKQIEVLNKKDIKETTSKIPQKMFGNYNPDNFVIDKRNKKTSTKFELSVSDLSKTKDGGSAKMMQEAYNRYKQQDYELALLYYKRALMYNPKSIEAMFGVGVCYHQLLQYNQAIEAYLKILSNNFSRKKIVSNLLLALSHKSNKEALDILLSIDEKILGYSDILSQIGLLYMRSGDNAKAISSLLRAYELSPTNAIISYNLGILYDKEGNIDYAKHFYEQAIRNDIFDIISKKDGVLLQDRIEQINKQILKDIEKMKKKSK